MNENIKGKYSILYIALAILHMLYLGIFMYSKSTILIYFNVLSIVLFLLLGVTVNHSKNIRVHFIFYFIEIVANAVLSTILCGMACGFTLVLFSNLPLAYFCFYMLYKNDNSAGKVAVFHCLIIIILCYVTLFMDFNGVGRKYYLSNTLEHIMCLINLTFSFLVLIGFLIVFVSKMNIERQTLTQEKEEIENSANYDPLTKLLNRRSLDKYFEMAISRVNAYESNFSILMCDIDNFKHVNDTYGHDCGDQVLKNIAGIIKSTIRSDDIAFRWGGEEMLIMVNAKGHIAKEVAERCRRLVEASSVIYNEQEIKVTITIGGASYYQGATKDELVHKADDNLYFGKNNGKNQVVM